MDLLVCPMQKICNYLSGCFAAMSLKQTHVWRLFFVILFSFVNQKAHTPSLSIFFFFYADTSWCAELPLNFEKFLAVVGISYHILKMFVMFLFQGYGFLSGCEASKIPWQWINLPLSWLHETPISMNIKNVVRSLCILYGSRFVIVSPYICGVLPCHCIYCLPITCSTLNSPVSLAS